jgi:ribosomal protein S18 acetylase RimI-like enzyme
VRAAGRAGARAGGPQGAIRPAAVHDLDRLAALWSALASHHAPLDPLFRLRPDAGARIRALLEPQLHDPDAALLVCDLGGDLAGFCAVRALRAPPIFEETERAEISDLAVRDGLRRRGIGRALAEAGLAWAAERGLGRVEVRVAAANREGQAFWRALGFGDLMDVLQRRL